ncbi:hypothetical protein HanPI659440_Chr14g0526881 [Helianthus annuus]|nr:hypothetical protein HanPI659440_Chr14g0526881 [Helianthus annuus]
MDLEGPLPQAFIHSFSPLIFPSFKLVVVVFAEETWVTHTKDAILKLVDLEGYACVVKLRLNKRCYPWLSSLEGV